MKLLRTYEVTASDANTGELIGTTIVSAGDSYEAAMVAADELHDEDVKPRWAGTFCRSSTRRGWSRTYFDGTHGFYMVMPAGPR